MSATPSSHVSGTSRRANVALWIVQALLSALFLFAGVVKLRMPAAVLAQLTGVPGSFMHVISVAEILGALGLVLPGLLRIGRRLTPAAAVGLVTIMAGATTITATHGPLAQALMPLTVGILAALVARGRRRWARPRAAVLPAGTWAATPVQGR